MRESLYKYMKVGLIYSMAYPAVAKGDGPILETIKKVIADAYFNILRCQGMGIPIRGLAFPAEKMTSRSWLRF